MATVRATLTALVHGDSGVGKSWLGQTTPAPRLVIDAEGRAQYPWPAQRKIYWDPVQGGPPEYDGTWDTCIVRVVDYNTMDYVFRWLRSGQHPFRSVTLDSLMEIQKRCVDVINPGVSALQWDNYGELLRRIDKLVREYRDLVMIPSNNVDVVLFIAGSKQDDKGTWKPIMQGQIRDQLAYYLDVVGYYFKAPDGAGGFTRSLLVDQQPGFVAKDGTDRFISTYGPVITNPNVETMLNLLNAKEA